MKWKFFDLLMEGNACPEEIHDHIDTWHNKANVMIPLHEFLGMSWQEFGRWVTLDATLETLEEERRLGRPIDKMTTEELVKGLPAMTNPAIKEEIERRLNEPCECGRVRKGSPPRSEIR
jgi:hypothetical protein